MIIELKGVQFANLGAQLMMHAVLSRLYGLFPKAQVAVRESHRLTTIQRKSINALRLLPMRKRRLDLNLSSYYWPHSLNTLLRQRWDCVAEGDLDMTIDASGYAYGDRWGRGALRATADQIKRFARFNKAYVFAPQAFGPFEKSRPDADYFVSALHQAHFVASRDQYSFDCLSELDEAHLLRSTVLRQVPDLTFGLTGYFDLSHRLGINEKTALIVPNVRMTDSVQATGKVGSYIHLLAELSKELSASGFEIMILNHGGSEDRLLCDALLKVIGLDQSHLIDSDNALQIKGVIGSAGLLIASRFHACISALDQNVPCLATSWSHKYQQLFMDFGLSDFVMKNLDVDIARKQLKLLLSSRDLVRQRCVGTVERIRPCIEQFWQRVAEAPPCQER